MSDCSGQSKREAGRSPRSGAAYSAAIVVEERSTVLDERELPIDSVRRTREVPERRLAGRIDAGSERGRGAIPGRGSQRPGTALVALRRLEDVDRLSLLAVLADHFDHVRSFDSRRDEYLTPLHAFRAFRLFIRRRFGAGERFYPAFGTPFREIGPREAGGSMGPGRLSVDRRANREETTSVKSAGG